MQLKYLFEDFIRDLKDCDPLDRQKLAAGYARTGEIHIAGALETLRTMLLTQSTEDVIMALEGAIEELEEGKSPVGSTEGIRRKIEVRDDSDRT